MTATRGQCQCNRHEEGARALARKQPHDSLNTRLQLDDRAASRRRHEDVERATELSGRRWGDNDWSGWEFYRRGQYDKAVEWTRARDRAEGDDATISSIWATPTACQAATRGAPSMGTGDQPEPDKDRLPVDQDKIDNGLSAAKRKSRPSTKKAPDTKRAAEPPSNGGVRCGLYDAKVNLWLKTS